MWTARGMFRPGSEPPGHQDWCMQRIMLCTMSSLHSPEVCAQFRPLASAQELGALRMCTRFSVQSHVYDWSGRWQPRKSWAH